MGTLNRSAFLAAAAASLGLGHVDGMNALSAPMLAYQDLDRRTRTRIPGYRQPAGAKLARQAYKRRIGISTIR